MSKKVEKEILYIEAVGSMIKENGYTKEENYMTKEKVTGADLIATALNYTIRSVDENKKFWMIRTKKGFFFEEFVTNQFVALGWNIITKETDFSKSQEEILRETVKNWYGESRPAGPINKCKSFIYDIQVGDYILIPSSGSERVAIAQAGEYFEDGTKEVKEELAIIPKIDNDEKEFTKVACPYRKRRYIRILKIISPSLMSYNLRQAISNYHGLSNLDKYSEDILNCLFDCYIYKGDLNITVNVKQENPLKPRYISKLLYSFTEFVCSLSNVDDISTTINLNSPGSVRMKLKNAVLGITKAKWPLIFLFIAITGGKAKDIEVPGVIGTIREAKTLNIEVEKAKLELEKEKEEVKAQQIENMSNALELYITAQNEGVDIEYVLQQLETLNSLDEELKFKSEDIGDIEVIQNKE